MEQSTRTALTDFKKYKAKMNEEMPKVMTHLDGIFQESLTEKALSLKMKELIIIGISVAIRCEACILVHVEKALMAGVTKDEVLEACEVGIAMGGGPAMAYVPIVLKFLEEHDQK